MGKDNLKAIELDRDMRSSLTIMLNIELRSRIMSKKYAETLNRIFAQLTGHDHENIKWYR